MIWIGTSGYNYPEWKGSFYPADLPAAKMLPYYAARFPTVEINYTFYRMPNEKLVGGWAAQTPSPYKLTLKAPRRITHDSRLKNCGELVDAFCQRRRHARRQARRAAVSAAAQLQEGPRRCSTRFSTTLPPRVRAAFEFRHPSWLDDEVFERLARRNLALCVADSEKLSTPVRVTADYAYFRLRDEGYTRRRHRALGRHDRARDRVVPRRVRLFQARGGREGAGVRAAADASARRRIEQSRPDRRRSTRRRQRSSRGVACRAHERAAAKSTICCSAQ